MYGHSSSIDILKEFRGRINKRDPTKSAKIIESDLGPPPESQPPSLSRCRKLFPIIKQDHPFRVKWDLIVMILSIINGITVPLDIAFQPPFFSNSVVVAINYIIDIMFVLDVLLNFRTTYINMNTGEEIFEPKAIALNYLFSAQFCLDFLSAISIDNLVAIVDKTGSTSSKFKILQLLKFFRLLRLSRFINTMNSSEDIKLSLKLFKMCLFLMLYIHCSGCVIFYVADIDKTWIPGQMANFDSENTFFELDFFEKYFLSIYNAMLSMLANDIYPTNLPLLILTNCTMLFGALINANIFGTIVVIVQGFNRKQ
jgi:hypothetical protein